MFFDTKLVEGLIGKKNAKAIGKAMARVRLRAMHSMKQKGKGRKPPKNQSGKAYLRWLEEVQNSPVSPPGSPPFSHTSDPVVSLRNIWYALDTSNRNELSGIVGPLRLNQKAYQGGVMLASGSVPKVMEFGGTIGIREKLENIAEGIRAPRKGPKRNLSARQRQAMIARIKANPTASGVFVAGQAWVRMGRRKPVAGQPTRVRIATYPKRPFMGPALKAEAPKFPSLWTGGMVGAA
jgi:hypothetical protein